MIARRTIVAALCIISLAGCASIEVTTGFEEVSALVVERGGASLSDASITDALAADDIDQPAKPTGSVSLDRALHLAVTNSPALRAEYARLAISRADVFQASLLNNPTFDANIGAGITGESARFALGAVYPILDLIYRKPRIEAARADFKALQVEVAEAVIDHANDVTRAYLDLAQSKARLSAREDVVTVVSDQFKAIEKLVVNGSIDSSNLAQSQATLTKAEIARDAELSEREAVRTKLASLIGSPLSSPLDATLPLDEIGENIETVESLTAKALQQRLDIIRAEQEVTVLKLALKNSGRLFSEDGQELGLELESEDSERFLGPSIAVEVPIFNQGKYRQAKAMAELIEAERRLSALEHSIKVAIHIAHQRVTARRRTALAHQNKLIPSAKTLATLARESLNVGAIDVADFLEAQLAIGDASLEAIDAKAEYWSARAELAKAVGGWPSTL